MLRASGSTAARPRGPVPLELVLADPEGGFDVDQDPGSGDLVARGLQLRHRRGMVYLWCPYNSRDEYPLQFEWGYATGRVFTEAGEFSAEFLAAVGA